MSLQRFKLFSPRSEVVCPTRVDRLVLPGPRYKSVNFGAHARAHQIGETRQRRVLDNAAWPPRGLLALPPLGLPTILKLTRSVRSTNPPILERMPGRTKSVTERFCFVPNNQRQHRTLHIQKNVLPYAVC